MTQTEREDPLRVRGHAEPATELASPAPHIGIDPQPIGDSDLSPDKAPFLQQASPSPEHIDVVKRIAHKLESELAITHSEREEPGIEPPPVPLPLRPYLRRFWMDLWDRYEITRIRQKLGCQERNVRLVVHPHRRELMLRAIRQAHSALEQDNVQKAKAYLYETEYQFLMARYEGHVIFHATKATGLVLGLYLLVFVTMATLTILYASFQGNSFTLSIILAAAGGGIGGVTAVMSGTVGIRLETQAGSARYIAKPILGAIMGTVTYFALASALSLFSNTPQLVSNMFMFFLVGFLGGYLENVFTRALNGLVDRLTGRKRPRPIAMGGEQPEDEV